MSDHWGEDMIVSSQALRDMPQTPALAPAPAPAPAPADAGGLGARPRKRCHVSTALLPAIEALAASGDTSTAVAFDLMARSLRRTPTPNP